MPIASRTSASFTSLPCNPIAMQSDAAPQSVHSSCCTNGTARRPMPKPSFLSAGKLSAICLLSAMRLLIEVLLERGQERDDEALAFDAHFRLHGEAGVEPHRLALRLERLARQLRLDQHVAAFGELGGVRDLVAEIAPRGDRADHLAADLRDLRALARLREA